MHHHFNTWLYDKTNYIISVSPAIISPDYRNVCYVRVDAAKGSLINTKNVQSLSLIFACGNSRKKVTDSKK